MIRNSKIQSITVLIFVLLIVLRIPYLGNPPAEYHGWRQSDTEAMARNFLNGNSNIFLPQLNYDGPPPNYAQLELQLTTFIIAGLYKLFGYHYLLARLVPLLFFLGSAYYIYKVAKKIDGQLAGWFALLVYGLFPFSIIFSRAIMPEAAALFFINGGIWYFLEWWESDNNWSLLAAVCFTALAISQKIPVAYIGLPFAYLIFKKNGLRALRKVSVWVFAILTLLPTIVYFTWLQGVADSDYVTGIATNLLLPAWRGGSLISEAGDFLFKGLFRAYSPLGLILACGGLFLLKKPWKGFFLMWSLAAVIEVVFIAAAIKLDYYLLLIAPLLALLSGLSLKRLYPLRWGRISMVFLIALLAIQGYATQVIYCRVNQELLNQARVLQENTAETDLLVLGNHSPELLNLSRRYGWRANIFYPQSPQGEVAFFLQEGASYYVVVNNRIEGDKDGSYLKYLKENYRGLELSQGITLFRIQF